MNTKTVFFIDKQKFEVDVVNLSVKQLLEEYAKEDPAETTLVLRDGNDLRRLEDQSQIVSLKDGMRFLVYHNGPTTVSFYGSDRLKAELEALGFTPKLVKGQDGNSYIVLENFEIVSGRFAGRIIDLGLLATADFPRTPPSAIHVRATPQLFDKSDSVPNVRNIIDSGLGPEWRYWSKNFGWTGERSARRLMSQINTVFETA